MFKCEIFLHNILTDLQRADSIFLNIIIRGKKIFIRLKEMSYYT